MKTFPKVHEMITSKFLRKEDLDGGEISVTIRDLLREQMPGDDAEQRWVLYFGELKKGLVLNTSTIRVLEKSYGSDSSAWVGKRVTLYVDENVTFKGQVVGGLRLRTTRVMATPAPAPAAAADFSDEIPA
jgi:hypothetical protein